MITIGCSISSATSHSGVELVDDAEYVSISSPRLSSHSMFGVPVQMYSCVIDLKKTEVNMTDQFIYHCILMD